jgi:hypothetical protein
MSDAARPFDPDDCQPTRWPIFRRQHVVVRPPAADKTGAQLAELTFSQWLDYYLAHPSFKNQRGYLLSDEHYCLLLDFVTSKIDGIAEFSRQRELDSRQQQWLYHHMGDNTYQYSMAEYKGASVAELDKGPLLVTFKEPAGKKGAKRKRRKADSDTARTQGLQRICVPYTYIERVVHYCHTGGLASSMHTGQLTTWDKLSALYHGINRTIVRMFVKKCAICQQSVKRVHKAALVPITAKKLFERVVIDLIDFTNKPSHGYHYILHVMDHFSKFHWAWALQDKRAATVAYHINCLLAETGPIKYPQCDNGREFIAEMLEALADFGCGPVVNGSAYHPQSQGLVERGNSMLKTALHHWFIQENTLDWYPVLARIRYQLNCNKPRTTQYTPYELVYGMKPPEWAGLNHPWPLKPDTLVRVLNKPSGPPTAVVLSSADPAVSILSSMASQQVNSTALSQPTTSSQLPLPASQLPLPESQLPFPESQLPVSELQLPATETDIFPNVVYDLPPGIAGPVNKYMADALNVGCHFVRLGGEGGGRCALSAFYNALSPMEYLQLNSRQRLKRYDDRRRELRAMWEELNADQQAASQKMRKDLRDLVYDVWFSGNEPTAEARTQEERREEAWAQFGGDLGQSTKSLGTEALAVLAHEHGVNVLLFVCHSQLQDFGARTKQAVTCWREATEQQVRDQLLLTKRQKGGVTCGWLQVESGTDMFLVPAYITQDKPWVVIYQRTTAEWKVRMEGGEEIVRTTPPNGHYEAVVKETITNGTPAYAGVFRMGDDTATEYDRVLQVATRLVAYQNSQAASQRMADDHDANVNTHVYRHLDAVGLRIPGRNPRKGNTPHSLPCLVVDVEENRRRAGTRTVVHRLYTLWCPHGVITDKAKVDKLVPLAINNFPALLHLRDERLTAQQRLTRSDPKWQPPLTTLTDVPRLTVKQAWEQHRASFKKRTEDQSRQRSAPTRTAADAAATSIAAGRADARTALSLHTLTNQAVPLHDSGPRSPSYIVRILHENKTQYKVLWSQPEGSPAVSNENRSWLDTHADYMGVVLAWRRERQQRQQQQDKGGADEGNDSELASEEVSGEEEEVLSE